MTNEYDTENNAEQARGLTAEADAELRDALPHGPMPISFPHRSGGDFAARVARWLELGGDVDTCTDLDEGCSRTLLWRAKYDNDTAAIEMLLRAGADPERVHGLTTEVVAELRAALPHGPMPLGSCGGDFAARVTRWLELGGDVDACVRGDNDCSRTLLWKACYDVETITIDLLLRAGADPARARSLTVEAETELRAALPHGPMPIGRHGDFVGRVARWLELSGDVDACVWWDKDCSRTLLWQACYANETDAIALLLGAGANPERPNTDGRYPIQVMEDNVVVGCPEYFDDCDRHNNWKRAQEAPYRERAQAGIALLLEHGARDVSQVFATVLAQDADSLRALLEAGYPANSWRRRLSMDYDREELWYWSNPLFQAVASRNPALCELLLAHGAKLESAQLLGCWALRYGGPELFELCLRYGSDPNEWHTEPGFRVILDCEALGRREIELLRDHGFDPYREGVEECPPLAFELCFARTWKDWLEVFPPEPNRLYVCGATLFHAAILRENYAMAYYLLERGADIDLPGLVNAYDPDSIAGFLNDRSLLGADPDTRPIRRFALSPLMMASLKGCLGLVMALTDRGADRHYRVPAGVASADCALFRTYPAAKKWPFFDYEGVLVTELVARHRLRVVSAWLAMADGPMSNYRKVEYFHAQLQWLSEHAAEFYPDEEQRRWGAGTIELHEIAAVENALRWLNVLDGWPVPPPEVRRAAIRVACGEFDSGLLESITPGRETSVEAFLGCLAENQQAGSAQDLGKFVAVFRLGLRHLGQWLGQLRF